MNIKTRRITQDRGSIECQGEYWKWNDREFCFVFDQDFMYSIHIPSGFSAYTINRSYYLPVTGKLKDKEQCISEAKDVIKQRSEKQWIDALDKIKSQYQNMNF